MAALFACTRCHNRFPFDDLSQGEQLCKDCRNSHTVKKCNYCRQDFQVGEKGSSSSYCKRCTHNLKIYGKPTACEYCNITAAFIGNKCQRCTNSEKKWGKPKTCEQCKQQCAFYRDGEEMKKVDGKLLCWLCTLTYKRVLAKARSSFNDLPSLVKSASSSSLQNLKTQKQNNQNSSSSSKDREKKEERTSTPTKDKEAKKISPANGNKDQEKDSTKDKERERDKDKKKVPWETDKKKVPWETDKKKVPWETDKKKVPWETDRDRREKDKDRRDRRDLKDRDKQRRDKDKERKDQSSKNEQRSKENKEGSKSDSTPTSTGSAAKIPRLDKSTSNGLNPSKVSDSSSFMDFSVSDNMVAITQLREEVESLKRQLTIKDQQILERDKKLTELKAQNYEAEKEMRTRRETAQKQHGEALEALMIKNRELQKQLAALSKSSKSS